MSDEVIRAKRALRSELRDRRLALSAHERGAAASGLTTQLDALVAARGARTISCFVSTPTEPGTRSFIAGAVRRGIRVLLPITRTDGLLDWAVADEAGDFREGRFGLSEPSGEPLDPTALENVDLMIIPAAAVDTRGTRLGWGRGYFDKTIASMSAAPPVYAVTFDSEVLESLPRELHDQPITGIVTPVRTIHLSPARH
ncbi:5-formyltetrahydrofolate cyclo-ligase [Microbacterium sp. A204]|uniref:5-formyltetrahydrofolate cyclo-ligase n=1 Tax=Microbacterium sp. A204 TaxID=3457321 RepID=UPI003FD09BC8